MTYSSHINAQDALGYSRLGIDFGMIQELCITGYVGSTKPRRRTMDDSKNLPPTKEWWAWYLSPPVNYREVYGDALEFDALDRYYQRVYEQNQKDKNT